MKRLIEHILLAGLLVLMAPAQAERIKDLAGIAGVRSNLRVRTPLSCFTTSLHGHYVRRSV